MSRQSLPWVDAEYAGLGVGHLVQYCFGAVAVRIARRAREHILYCHNLVLVHAESWGNIF
jgi:hypothetical protein